MARFKPTSVFVLKRETKASKYWRILRGNKKNVVNGLYQGWITIYKFMEDPARITKIEIRVFREK